MLVLPHLLPAAKTTTINEITVTNHILSEPGKRAYLLAPMLGTLHFPSHQIIVAYWCFSFQSYSPTSPHYCL
jgi:hypothetical protein